MRDMHTPGPWTVIEASRGDSSCGDRYVAVQTPEFAFDVIAPPYLSPIGAFANARLIAAAPNLLEALKAMTDPSFGNPSDPDETRRIEALAAAAIAKAEGR